MKKDESRSAHTFHIPVMGTAFTIDTPLKVARYGISSVIPLADDILIEQMRKHYCEEFGEPYTEIARDEEDGRARRITTYLNLLHRRIEEQVRELRNSPFVEGSEITRYFEMLPESPRKDTYLAMCALPEGDEKTRLQEELRRAAVPGSIDVNIMTKVDRTTYRDGKALPKEHCEAMSGLRGYANSTLSSSIVYSAGMNPRLYSYTASFPDFFPDEAGRLKKKVVLKVSDFRSAVIQGKYLAKRGLWVSEFRIESGLNCGGHAFATNGQLAGPILEQFKEQREGLRESLHGYYSKALERLGRRIPDAPHEMRVSYQGGIGTAFEDRFLLSYYAADATGWGSPFLLAPDTTNVDEETLRQLTPAGEGDIYLSESSPLGLPFWNLRSSASEEARRERIAAGKPGSSCRKGFLRFSTEFTEIPICAASRAYLKKKLPRLEEEYSPEQLPSVREEILAKSCLCQDLSGAAEVKYGIDPSSTPAICPGPNTLNFSRTTSLEEMAGHIYGRLSLLTNPDRPHMFIQELGLYVKYLRKEAGKYSLRLSRLQPQNFHELRKNLLEGIEYYRRLAGEFLEEQKDRFAAELAKLQAELEKILLPAEEGLDKS
jgi:hypothetical protein